MYDQDILSSSARYERESGRCEWQCSQRGLLASLCECVRAVLARRALAVWPWWTQGAVTYLEREHLLLVQEGQHVYHYLTSALRLRYRAQESRQHAWLLRAAFCLATPLKLGSAEVLGARQGGSARAWLGEAAVARFLPLCPLARAALLRFSVSCSRSL